MIKVVHIEDHKFTRDMLRESFSNFDDICIVGGYEKGEDFVEALPALDFDVALLDVVLKRSPMQGDEVARHIRRKRPDVKTIAVSSESNIQTMLKMLTAGIDGFVSKDEGNREALAAAIRSVMNGSRYYTQDMSSILSKIAEIRQKKKDISGVFTEQEVRILELSSEGLQGKEVADFLNISIRTVEKHKNNIFKKAEVNNTAEAVMYAIANELFMT